MQQPIHNLRLWHDDATGAIFSPCGRYRYTLWRTWNPDNARMALFLMLNPSTADEEANDPTVTRCVRFAQRWGYRRLTVCNLFAYRATDPSKMKASDNPIGPENDDAILCAASRADIMIAAWGVHGAYLSRDQEVIRSLRPYRTKLHTLGLTKYGHPRHPLYLRSSTMPSAWHPYPSRR